jgi:hypothetical protein
VTDQSRSHRDRREIQRKLALLREPHVAPLTAYVERLHATYPGRALPWFDPTEAGVAARILMLSESPGPRAALTGGSSFVSVDNDDESAANCKALLREAGIDRARALVTWNIVPWYLGNGRKVRHARIADLDEARPALLDLLALLPELRVVVLCGRQAQRGWDRARPDLPPTTLPRPPLAVLRCPHSSPRNLSTRPESRATILATYKEARRLAGL